MKSIRQQLTRELIGVLAGLLGLGLAALAIAVWLALTSSFDATLRARAISVSALTELEHGQVQFDFSEDFLREFGGTHPRGYFEIWDTTGRSLIRSPSLHEADLPHGDPGTPVRPKFLNLRLPNGRPARALSFLFQPKPSGESLLPTAIQPLELVVAMDREDLNETLGGLIAAIAGCGALLLPAVLFIVPRVLRRGLLPLDDLADQAGHIDAHSLATRFPAGPLPVELQPIARRLNDLLERLEQSFDRERRFSADLAHELRTPLAELRNLAECSLKWPDLRGESADRDTLAIAQQMERIVSQILALARGEEHQLPANLELLVLEPCVHEAWQAFADRAAARGVSASWSVAPVQARLDRALLQSVLTNLFSNAVDYTPAGGVVEIRVEPTARQFKVSIANANADLEPADVSRLFDRFWRKEAARSGGHHLGLGLPLARAFASAMHCTLEAVLDERNQVVFILTGDRDVTENPSA